MMLDGACRDAKFHGDLVIAFPLQYQLYYFDLSICEGLLLNIHLIAPFDKIK